MRSLIFSAIVVAGAWLWYQLVWPAVVWKRCEPMAAGRDLVKAGLAQSRGVKADGRTTLR